MTKKKYELGMILKGYPRISETFISNEIFLLEQLGFRIHIFSMREPRERFSHENIKRIKARVNYLPEKILPNLFILLYHNIIVLKNNYERYKYALKIAMIRFSRTRKSATFKHLLQAGYLVNLFLKNTPITHFHAHFAHSPASVAMFVHLLSDLPFSFTAHAKDIYTSDDRQLKEKIERAEFVVTCTDYNRRYLKRLSKESGAPIYLSYHGIDISLFKRREHKDMTEPYQIMTVARMTEKKGIPTILKALSLLKRRNVSFKYALIGDGDDYESISNLVEEMGLSKEVTLTGTLAHDEVIRYYQQSDIFVLGCQISKNGDRDGIPNVLVESMAMGVPVVVTSVSAIPELIKDGISGLLIPPNDPEKMASAIIRIIFDEKLRDNIIAAAASDVRQFFDNKKLIIDLSEIYSQHLK